MAGQSDLSGVPAMLLSFPENGSLRQSTEVKPTWFPGLP